MADIDFAALLCSRLCHDLVSPVGAITNGLEILQEEQEASMREAVLDLIEKSTRQTSNKLQFFRLAFGAAGGFSSRLDLRECEKATLAFLEGSKVTLEWSSDVSSGSKDFVKLLLNLALVVSETMIRGGTLHVNVTEKNARQQVSVKGAGQRIILQEGVRNALEGKADESKLDPRAAPAFLAHTMASTGGSGIRVDILDETTLLLEADIDFAAESSEE